MSQTGASLSFGTDELKSIDSFRRRTDTAVLTVMFTDIEGFTELTDSRGEEHANRVRRIHDDVLEGIITRDESGIVVKPFVPASTMRPPMQAESTLAATGSTA